MKSKLIGDNIMTNHSSYIIIQKTLNVACNQLGKKYNSRDRGKGTKVVWFYSLHYMLSYTFGGGPPRKSAGGIL